MSEIESRFVHRGLWVNVDKGSIMGRTITTDIKTGTMIVGLLAILASLAISHLWHLVTFLAYQSRRETNDAMFMQQQVILRTLPTPSAVVTDFAKIYWAWGSTNTAHRLLRSLPLALLAALFTCAAVATGVFSSYIVDSSSLEILAESPFCGPIEPSEDSMGIMGSNYSVQVKALAQDISNECYLLDNPTSARCKVYVPSRVPLTVEEAECPWGPALCDSRSGTAVSVDSGLVHPNKAFGLNLSPKDAVHFRRKVTCSVLPLDNRTYIVPAAEFPYFSRPPLPQEEILLVSLGNFSSHGKFDNATFAVSLTRTNASDEFGMRNLLAYTDPRFADPDRVKYIPELKRNDSDTVLKLIAKNKVVYSSPVDDPLFSAHIPWTDQDTNETSYFPDFPVAVVGCAEQVSYLPASLTTEDLPGANDVQLATLRLLLASSYYFDMGYAENLRASALVGTGGYVDSLPNDQWVKEVAGWESTTWAMLQVAVGDYFTGAKARDPYADSYASLANSEGEKALCTKLRMRRSGGFVNINFFALVFVCTFALVVVALDVTILRFCIFLSGFRRMHWLGPRIERWTQDGVLQIQRRLLEAQGQEGWEDLDKEVPIRVCVFGLSGVERKDPNDDRWTDRGKESPGVESIILPGVRRNDTGWSGRTFSGDERKGTGSSKGTSKSGKE
ncbi:hypothetical protein BDV96DRAFT_509152 [Lophiotrema nucula]|uniref:Uncharacterized protein n=1 Tax=Lophiotrema nucula TaxID=690887 RepID=A0A6A5YE50_9PLEO|nr:hypothetical protein BDV96DRAFT_509152 [Lophiotrema nucula]